MRNVRLCFIFFFILLLSSSIVSAGFWDFITGKVTGETCTDSDNGKDYYIKGTVSNIKGDSLTDYCVSGYASYNIIEGYCGADGSVLNTGYLCPNGCKDGTCIQKSFIIKGKLVDKYSRKPLANVLVSHLNNKDGWKVLETSYTNSNGEFEFEDSTYEIGYILYFAPDCYSQAGIVGNKNPDTSVYEFYLYDTSEYCNEKMHPVANNVVDLGEVGLQPAADIDLNLDTPKSFNVYQKSKYCPYDIGGAGNANQKEEHYLRNVVLLNHENRIVLDEGTNKVVNSGFHEVPYKEGCYKIRVDYKSGEFTWSNLIDKYQSEKVVCTDSDAGKDFKVKGAVSNTKGDSLTDYCVSGYASYNIIEGYCGADGSVLNTGYLCQNGCKDGACVSTIDKDGDGWEDKYGLDPCPDEFYNLCPATYSFDSDKDGIINMYDACDVKPCVTVKGKVIKSGAGLATYVYWYGYPSSGESVQGTIDSKDGTFTVYADKKYFVSSASFQFSLSRDSAGFGVTSDGTLLFVSLGDGSKTEKKVTVVNNVLDLGEINLGGAVGCTDSDAGKDFKVKGTASNTKGNSLTDYCVSGYASYNIIEGYCGLDGSVLNTGYLCPNGCNDGACVILEISICTDSDNGKDYYVKGNASSKVNRGLDGKIYTRDKVLDFEDSCCVHCLTAPSETGPNLMEWWCKNEVAENTVYGCPNGCEDGACIKPLATNCTDSDNGKDYYVKGFMKSGQNDSGQWDVCYDNKELVEYYCNNGVGSKLSYKCPNGCKDGACVAEDTPLSFDYLDLLPMEFLIVSDICASGTSCNELYADVMVRNRLSYTLNNVVITMSIPQLGLSHKQTIAALPPDYGTSPKQYNIKISRIVKSGKYGVIFTVNYKLANGDEREVKKEFERHISQIEDVKCSDPDGADYYKKDKVVITLPSGYSNTAEDSCCVNCMTTHSESGPYVSEYVCNGNNRERVIYFCPNGCKDGACIKSVLITDKPNPPIDLSNYPKMLIKDNRLIAYLVVGDKASADNVIALSEIANSLQYESIQTTTGTTVQIIDVGISRLASEIPDPLKLNIISFGGPCSNAVTAQLMGNPADCTKGFTKDEGLIKLYNYNGYAQIVVAGYSEQDTRKAARVLANWEDYDLGGNEKCVYGSLTNPSVKNCGEKEQICTDSDGGKAHYVKGTTSNIKGDSLTDYCVSGYASYNIIEGYCGADGSVLNTGYLCPNGCKDGACIKDTCEDYYECPDGTIARCYRGENGICECEACEEIPELGCDSTKLELIGKASIAEVKPVLAELDLQVLLNDDRVENAKGTAPYTQKLSFTNGNTGYVDYLENDQDIADNFLYFKSGYPLARYELNFATPLWSDVDDSSGSKSTTGLYLTDIEDVDITMLGKGYTIVSARKTTAEGNGDNIKLILMSGAVKDALLEGNTKTYTIDGKNYEVSLDFVSSTAGNFTINGEGTRKLLDGETDKLSDGTTIGVSEILYQDYAGGVHSVTFFLGAEKIELSDTNVEDTIYSDNLKVNDETIDDAYVIIEGTNDNYKFEINRIIVNMIADDDYYVPAGGKLSENDELNEPDVLFTQNWDIRLNSYNNGKAIVEIGILCPIEEEQTIENITETICDGCLQDGKCITYGIRLIKENVPVYCGITNDFVKQKEEQTSCQNNYECSSNVCVNNQCISQNLIQKIINFFRNLFG